MGPDLAVLHLVLVKKGAEDIPGGPRHITRVSQEFSRLIQYTAG